MTLLALQTPAAAGIAGGWRRLLADQDNGPLFWHIGVAVFGGGAAANPGAARIDALAPG